jgi:hypothetical protein
MNALADRVLKITAAYLGPASKVFLERQTRGHMGVEFADIQAAHLPKLLYWIRLSSRLLVNQKADLLLAQLMKELNVTAVAP